MPLISFRSLKWLPLLAQRDCGSSFDISYNVSKLNIRNTLTLLTYFQCSLKYHCALSKNKIICGYCRYKKLKLAAILENGDGKKYLWWVFCNHKKGENLIIFELLVFSDLPIAATLSGTAYILCIVLYSCVFSVQHTRLLSIQRLCSREQ